MSYFDNLLGTPEPTRRENWDGREEPLSEPVRVIHTWEQALIKLDRTVQGILEDTIDIDYEEVP